MEIYKWFIYFHLNIIYPPERMPKFLDLIFIILFMDSIFFVPDKGTIRNSSAAKAASTIWSSRLRSASTATTCRGACPYPRSSSRPAGSSWRPSARAPRPSSPTSRVSRMSTSSTSTRASSSPSHSCSSTWVTGASTTASAFNDKRYTCCRGIVLFGGPGKIMTEGGSCLKTGQHLIFVIIRKMK